MRGSVSLRHLNHLFSKTLYHTDNDKTFALFYFSMYLRPGFTITGRPDFSVSSPGNMKNWIQPHLIDLTIEGQWQWSLASLHGQKCCPILLFKEVEGQPSMARVGLERIRSPQEVIRSIPLLKAVPPMSVSS